MGLGGPSKRHRQPTDLQTPGIAACPSPGPEQPSSEMDGHLDSTETQFQEMDARLQANEHTLTNISSNIAEIAQILRQPARPSYQDPVLPTPSMVEPFRHALH